MYAYYTLVHVYKNVSNKFPEIWNGDPTHLSNLAWPTFISRVLPYPTARLSSALSVKYSSNGSNSPCLTPSCLHPQAHPPKFIKTHHQELNIFLFHLKIYLYFQSWSLKFWSCPLNLHCGNISSTFFCLDWSCFATLFMIIFWYLLLPL